MTKETPLRVGGYENEVNRVKLLVSLTGKHEVVEAVLWGPPETYLATYNPEKWQDLERKIAGGDYLPHEIRELLFQRVGATMSIGADEINIRYSLATPCLTYVYRKLADSTEILHNPPTTETIIGRRLEYVLLGGR